MIKRTVGLVGVVGGFATSNDTPTVYTQITDNVYDDKRVLLGVVKYGNLLTCTRTQSFMTWAVAFDTSNNGVLPLDQTRWSVNLDSTKANQKATPTGVSEAVTVFPNLNPPFANDSNKVTISPAGVGTVTFTK